MNPAPFLDLRVTWMRQASLLAAECLVRMPADAPFDPRAPFADEERWSILARAAEQGVSLDYWLFAALVVVERYPDAAAAFSILAEDERLLLPTPAAFARIAVAGLEADYDAALAVALASSSLHKSGLVERVEPAGTVRPLAQQGLRLAAGQAAMLFGAEAPSAAQEIEACPGVVLHPRPACTAATLLDEAGAVWIRGRSRRMARQFALDVAGTLSRGVLFVRGGEGVQLPQHSADHLVVLDLFDLDKAPALPLRGDAQYVVIAPQRMDHPGFRALDAPCLSNADCRALWQMVPLQEPARDRLAQRFHLTLPELRAALGEADLLLATQTPIAGVEQTELNEGVLEQAIRSAGARCMGPSVSLVESDVTLDDLVVRPEMRAQLEDVVAWHRNDAHVWESMGMRRDTADARGLSLLFSGPPGGGKTFAARCLANALGLNLYRIDLSQVVSKYIGETEKALARVFDEAEAGHGLLFFDEADAIFGKRSEVKDAHDRYANIEVGFLLQRMETFDGVMVLATNLRSNLDPAFLRRIRFVIEFPMPSRGERRLLWERNLPQSDWRDPALDVDVLAQRFPLSGGNIRNAAVAAAHLAAAERGQVGPGHLARALFRELEKSGLPRAPSDFGPLAVHLEDRQ